MFQFSMRKYLVSPVSLRRLLKNMQNIGYAFVGSGGTTNDSGYQLNFIYDLCFAHSPIFYRTELVFYYRYCLK